MTANGTDAAIELLRARGAETIEHPGGRLLAHLRRVHDRLAEWGANDTVRLAGLCHAAYGTDGFPTALLELTERATLVGVIGEAAEQTVYHYGGCDRAFSYPGLGDEDGAFRDRFTGTEFVPDPVLRRDFVAITVANELDLADVSPEFRTEYGAGLWRLFTRIRPMLSEPAWRDCAAILGGE